MFNKKISFYSVRLPFRGIKVTAQEIAPWVLILGPGYIRDFFNVYQNQRRTHSDVLIFKF